MNKKPVSGMMLALLLISMLMLAFNLQPLRASGTIYIRPDGTVEGTDKIHRAGDIYTFTDNIYDSIVIERDNIVVDGVYYLLQGTGSGRGIDLTGRSNVTIKNMKIKAFYHCIFVSESSNNIIIQGNNITSSDGWGIWILDSNYNIVLGNNITANSWGIRLQRSSHNAVFENNITNNNSFGLMLDGYSSNNIISDNNITANNYDGVYLYCTSNNIVHGNKIANNKWSGIRLHIWSNNNSISNNVISNNSVWPDGYGLRLVDSDKNTISGNMITNNRYGVLMQMSRGNCFRNNEIVGNSFNLGVNGSALSEYIHDIDTSNTVDGKPIYYWINKHDMQIPADAGYVAAINSTNITVKDLHLKNNGEGVLFAYTESSLISEVNASKNVFALYLHSSSYNTIRGNNLSNNSNGMYIDASSRFNNIIGNTIASNNANGIYLFASDNTFYHNNFVNNKKYQVEVGDYINSWDNGYPSGGNYWSDHFAFDGYSGPNQDEPGYDGIGDTPYVIDENNQDNYPLMNPYIAGDVNYDGMVNASDLSMLGDSYGAGPDESDWNIRADTNSDFIVDVMDLFTLGKNYGMIAET